MKMHMQYTLFTVVSYSITSFKCIIIGLVHIDISSSIIPTTTSMVLSGTIDPTVTTAHSGNDRSSHLAPVVAGVVVGVVVCIFIVLLTVILVWYQRRRRKENIDEGICQFTT